MLGEALSFPTNGDETLKTMIIGAACLVFSFLILPAILIQGYLVRVLRAGAEGSEEPPVFDEWGEMLVDGLKLFVISLAYFIVPIVLWFIATSLFVGGVLMGTAGDGAAGGIGAGVGLVGVLLVFITFLLFLAAGYLLPAAATNFARKDDIGAAFDVDTVTSGALTAEYLVAAVIAIVLGLVLNMVGSFLLIVLVGFLVLFYAQVAVYYLLARGFARGLGEDEAADEGAPADAGAV